MMRLNLQRRLERLEQAVLPIEGEPTMRVEVYYHSPDGTEELGYVVEVPRHRDWTDSLARKTKVWR